MSNENKCSSCGEIINNNGKFCKGCGMEVLHNKSSNEDKEETRKGKTSFLQGVFGIIAFVIAFSVVSNLTKNGFSYFKNKNTSSKVENYFSETLEWKEFNSALAGFYVLFPVYPSHESTPTYSSALEETITLELYSSEQKDGTTYAVAYIKYPEKTNTSVPENNLEGALNGMLQGNGSKLISSNFSNFNSYKAVDFVAYIEKDGIYIKGKIILAGKVLYQLQVIYETKNSANVQYDKFINSFKIQ